MTSQRNGLVILMDKLKSFFKNLTTEYLRIAETRKTCPHVIKFEKVTNYICCLIIALLVVFGIATSASAQEPTSVERATGNTAFNGVYKFTSSNIDSVNSFIIEDVPIYTLNTLGIFEDNYIYDGIRYKQYSKHIELRDAYSKEWTLIYNNGDIESFISSYIYIPFSVVPTPRYTEFSKFYSHVTSDKGVWTDLTECYHNGGLDSYHKYFPEGYDIGYAKGHDDGYNLGYSEGYDVGFVGGMESSKPFSNIIGDIFDGLDNFIIFADFSILDIIKSIMGIFLAVWLLKLIAGG